VALCHFSNLPFLRRGIFTSRSTLSLQVRFFSVAGYCFSCSPAARHTCRSCFLIAVWGRITPCYLTYFCVCAKFRLYIRGVFVRMSWIIVWQRCGGRSVTNWIGRGRNRWCSSDRFCLVVTLLVFLTRIWTRHHPNATQKCCHVRQPDRWLGSIVVKCH